MSQAGAREPFGVTPDGLEIDRCTISAEGITARVLTLGGVLQSLQVHPHLHSLVLGYPSLQGYLQNPACLGAVIGRFANRIGGAELTLEGRRYPLDPNQGGRHTLHGGREGFHLQRWELLSCDPRSVRLRHCSPSGHMGFPGELSAEVLYEVSPYQLSITLSATTDTLTCCALTSHSYFNLSGEGTIGSHLLQVDMDQRLEVDEELIPTGRLLPVEGTEYDLQTPTQLSRRGSPIALDHHLCSSPPREDLRALASLEAKGIKMELSSSAPGIQIYTGEGLSGASVAGCHFEPFSGVALEPQRWPDAPNHPHFPSALLRPGERYENVITLGFRTS